MRRALAAVVAGLALAAAGASLAQPYGHYRGWGGYGYRYEPPRAYGPDGRYTPYRYDNGYDGYNELELARGRPGAAGEATPQKAKRPPGIREGARLSAPGRGR